MALSVQPLSSAAFSSLIWELDNGNYEAIFGANPIEEGGDPPTVEAELALGRLASALAFLRNKVIPRVINSLNTSQITLVHRTQSSVSGDPLGRSFTEETETIYAVIAGPTTESLEKGLLDISDYEVLVPAYTLDTPLTEEDGVRIGGLEYDIVAIQAYPKVPDPVAYRYWCKRVV